MNGGVEERMAVGKSMLVPSVQELAKQCLESKIVPNRYVHSENDPDRLILLADDHGHDDEDHHFRVPIISLEGLISGDEHELQRLHVACKDWGFFQLINHGVNSSLVEKFKSETQHFFNQPIEEKKKYWQTPTDVEGFGQIFVVSDQQKLDWADTFFFITLPQQDRNQNLFPLLPLSFRETVNKYAIEMQNLAMKIMECMARSLNIDVETMKDLFKEGDQSMRMNYYPPCPQPDKVIGLTPHSDGVGLTILLQLNEIEGLQIRNNDRWVSIKPLPDAFIVNIGDILEIVTNGIYRSILHRAVVNDSKERLSVATFYSPAKDREIGPISNLITSGTQPKFKRINMIDYWNGLFARKLDGKSYLDVMRINPNNDGFQESDTH